MASELPAVDMRHTKLKPEEAALIAGELVKPSWASRNEGIHERVSFEDTLWGFEMAGGAYYKTPLRITYVKPGSRAEQACIRMGDTVLRIQGIDTSTLTLQEAHKLVHEAGINLKIAVTSPDDLQDAHYEYQDPLMQDGGLTAEQLKAMEMERIQKAIARAIRCRDLEWPWVRRKFIIYRESNCFMVPSKYENKHRDQFPELPAQKIDYFFPTQKLEKVGPQTKQKNKISEEKDKSKIEEEEEIVSEKEEEQENLEDSENQRENTNGRLQEDSIPEENLEQKDATDSIQNEIREENGEETSNTIRKDSEGSSNFELDNNNNHVSKNKDLSELNSENTDTVENASENVEVSSENIETVENNSEIVGNDSENVNNLVENKADDVEIDSKLDNEIINELAKSDSDVNTNIQAKTDDEVIDSVLSGHEDNINER